MFFFIIIINVGVRISLRISINSTGPKINDYISLQWLSY
jgi:hypothetical protein